MSNNFTNLREVFAHRPDTGWEENHSVNGQFSESDADPKFIDLLLDDAFKRTFGKGGGERVLLPFLRMVLPEKDIEGITYTDTEHTNPFKDRHDVRIDVECVSLTGERFMVELQRARQDCFIKRTLYYASFAIFQQMAKGRRDYNFMPVYVISILNFSLKGSLPGEVEHRSGLTWEEDGSEATDALNLIFIELPNHRKMDDPDVTRLDKFCFLMRNMPQFVDKPDTEGDELLENLVDSADFSTLSERDKIKFRNDMTTERDIRNQIEYAREDGERIGLMKGREEGRKQATERIIREFIASGVAIDIISKATGISVKELQKLRSKIPTAL